MKNAFSYVFIFFFSFFGVLQSNLIKTTAKQFILIENSNLTLTNKDAALSDFCSTKRYDNVLFIAQQTPRKYLIFGADDLYYSGTFSGQTFTDIPEGPFKLTGSSPLKGVKSVAAYLATSPSSSSYISLLFIAPKANPNLVLQFLGDQVWLIDTSSGEATSVSWPPSDCPAQTDGIINRAVEPHLLFDKESYAYNLSVSGSGQMGDDGAMDYKIVCGARSQVQAFPENNYGAMLGVDPPHDNVEGSHCSAGIELFRWMRNRLICKGCLSETVSVTLPFCDLHSQLANRWAIFGCPDPALGEPTPSWLVGLYIFIAIVVLVALAITAYFLAKRLIRNSKDEILQADISSKIG